MFVRTDPNTWLNFDLVGAVTVVPHRDKPGKFVTLAHFAEGRTWILSTADDRYAAIVEAEEILVEAGLIEDDA